MAVHCYCTSIVTIQAVTDFHTIAKQQQPHCYQWEWLGLIREAKSSAKRLNRGQKSANNIVNKINIIH